MRLNISSFRVWLFRGLVAIAAGLIVTSAIMPWWTCGVDILGGEEEEYFPFVIEIYQYGLPPVPDIDPEQGYYIAGDITPFYQIVLAWVYLGASVGLILFSTWLRGRKGRWLLGGIGLVYIAYAAIAAFIVIAGRLGDFGLPLQGFIDIMVESEEVEIDASLRFGYYLAYAAGFTCLVLALLRNKIIGKPKLSA